MKKITIIILAVVLISLGLIYGKRFNLLGGCDKEIVQSIEKEGSKIQIYVLDCGATTDYSTHVAIANNQNKFDDVVTIKGDHSSDIKLNWLTSSSVDIEYKGKIEDTFNFKDSINNVNFSLTPLKI